MKSIDPDDFKVFGKIDLEQIPTRLDIDADAAKKEEKK